MNPDVICTLLRRYGSKVTLGSAPVSGVIATFLNSVGRGDIIHSNGVVIDNFKRFAPTEWCVCFGEG